MTNVDVIVAGAGIWGCTVARRLADAGKKVLVLEKRAVVGGNVCCEIDEETGIEIHKYGSHIFHTHIPEVWEFVNRFVKFNGYQHKVLAHYKGKTYFLPFGLALINKFFNVELKPGEVADFMAGEANSKAIFDTFFRGYASKQWGKPPEEIDTAVMPRAPQKWYNAWYIDMSGNLPMRRRAGNAKVRYSAAYPTGREHSAKGTSLPCGLMPHSIHIVLGLEKC